MQLPLQALYYPVEYLFLFRYRPVGVQLDEHPFWTASHMNPQTMPDPHAVESRWIVSRQVTVFNARQAAELAALPVQAEWALDEQQLFAVAG